MQILGEGPVKSLFRWHKAHIYNHLHSLAESIRLTEGGTKSATERKNNDKWDGCYVKLDMLFTEIYAGHSENFANGLITLFRVMLRKHTVHILKVLHFVFKMVPNTVQKNIFLIQLQRTQLGPSHNTGLILYENILVWIIQVVNRCKYTTNLSSLPILIVQKTVIVWPITAKQYSH